MRASLIFSFCNWQIDVLKRSEWMRRVVTRRDQIRTLRRMIQSLEVQLPDSPTEVKGEREVDTKWHVRISQRGRAGGRAPTFSLAVLFTDFGVKETFPTKCSLSQADPHLIPLQTLEICKTIPLHNFKSNILSVYVLPEYSSYSQLPPFALHRNAF
jgi:hypothetical protein